VRSGSTLKTVYTLGPFEPPIDLSFSGGAATHEQRAVSAPKRSASTSALHQLPFDFDIFAPSASMPCREKTPRGPLFWINAEYAHTIGKEPRIDQVLEWRVAAPMY